MLPKKPSTQLSLLKVSLDKICNSQHELVRLAENVDWSLFEAAFGKYYSEVKGRPGKPIRLMVGLCYLKSMYNESDEQLIEKWIENPYWQYFCGETEFQHSFPIEPSTLVRFRHRIKEEGFELLLKETISVGLSVGAVKKNDLERVNVDTTVQEKEICFPTDGKLYHRMREKLVEYANRTQIKLRQTYGRKSKRALRKQGQYRHARQEKRARKELKQVKCYLGRVLRELERKAITMVLSDKFNAALAMARKLFDQKRDDSNKIYSLHAPEVECIAKGKAHKKYEFGCKVSLVTSSKGNFIVGAKAIHGNPYDGHTLETALKQSESLLPSGIAIEHVFADAGYRGHNIKNETIEIHVVKAGAKNIKPSLKRWMKRRNAIEPIIGHCKNDGGPRRNHLLGKDGDKINALGMALGFNMRKCLRVLFLYFIQLHQLFAFRSHMQRHSYAYMSSVQ